MFKSTVFSLALFCTAFAAHAANSPVLPGIQIQAPYITLPAGTVVNLQLNQVVVAEEVSVGNALEFKTRGEVRVNGMIVIANGARATGWVTNVRKACDGKCSEITFTVEEVQAIDGQMVPLNSTPHTIKAPCCDGIAVGQVGTNIRANTLTETKIKDK